MSDVLKKKTTGSQDSVPQPERILEAILQGESIPESAQGAVFTCFRKGQNVVWRGWHEETNWFASLRQAFAEFFEMHGNGSHSLVEVCLSYQYRPIKSENLPPNSQIGRKGLVVQVNDDVYVVTPFEMIADNTPFADVLDKCLKESEADSNNAQETLVGIKTFEAIKGTVTVEPTTKKIVATPIYRCGKLVLPSDVTRESTSELAQDLSTWMNQNVAGNGRLTYKYWPNQDLESKNNNMIRQFMGTVCLFRIAQFYDKPLYRKNADKNLAYNLKNYYRDENDELGMIAWDKKVKLGACALAGISILQQKGFEKHLERLEAMTFHLWQENGAFQTFFQPANRNDCQNFYPGETLLFWAYLYQRTRSEALLKKFMLSVEHYQKFHLEQRNPAFVPWHTQAYFELWQITQDEKLVSLIFDMNDWLLDFQQWESAPHPDMKGRFYDPKKPYGPPHASATGVYIEGLIDAYRLAEFLDDASRMEAYGRTILRALRSVMQLQFKNESDAFYCSKPKKVMGGVRTTVYNNEIRVDNVQHNLMGIFKVLESSVLDQNISVE